MVGAAMLSVLIFPSLALTLLRRAGVGGGPSPGTGGRPADAGAP